MRSRLIIKMDILPVSIVIPNFNGEQILTPTLKSVLKASSAYKGEIEILLVDDASTDKSMELISSLFSEIKILKHNKNKGFSEAVGTGVKGATHSIIILLNSDVIPDVNFISPLISWFNRPDIFSVSPLILDKTGNPQRVSWTIGHIKRGEMRKENWDITAARKSVQNGHILKSLYASGGSVAFRKKMFLELGGFLPLYKPFYVEDRDLGTRAWKKGWQTIFEPRSMVTHDHVGTIKHFFAKKKIKIIRKRNRFFYLWLHFSTPGLIFLHFPWILIRLPLRILKFDFVYPIALFNALTQIKKMIYLRKKLKTESEAITLEEILDNIKLSYNLTK